MNSNLFLHVIFSRVIFDNLDCLFFNKLKVLLISIACTCHNSFTIFNNHVNHYILLNPVFQPVLPPAKRKTTTRTRRRTAKRKKKAKRKVQRPAAQPHPKRAPSHLPHHRRLPLRHHHLLRPPHHPLRRTKRSRTRTRKTRRRSLDGTATRRLHGFVYSFYLCNKCLEIFFLGLRFLNVCSRSRMGTTLRSLELLNCYVQ